MEHAGHGLAQKRVAEPVRPGQQGIPGWELAALGNVLDEPQVHRHVAVAALTGVQRAGYLVQHMGVQQV